MASATKAAASKSVQKAKPTAGTKARAGKVPGPGAAATAAKKAPAPVAKRSGATSAAPARASRSASRPASGTKTGTNKAQTAVRKAATKETVKSPVTSTTRSVDKAEKKKAAAPAKAPAKATTKAPAKASAQTQKATTPASSSAAPGRNGAKPAARPPAGKAAAGPYAGDDKFLAEQRHLLESERAVYQSQASDLKAEADSLAQEREPGDVQFDEESGEGGTVTVDRERDLALSAQALAAVEEIDAALARIEDKTYGACERCHQPIPKPRLKALPFARLCVACKSGGLSRR